MANTTLGGMVLDGDGQCFITDNSCRKEAMIVPMPLYLNDSDNTDVFDYGGVIKTLNLSGLFIGTSIGNAKTFMDNAEAMCQGHQDTDAGYPLTFIDDFRGTIKVKIQEFESTKEGGSPLIVRWNIKLVQSSTNA